jgi:hypothetical protein
MALLQEKVSLAGAWLDNLTVGFEAITGGGHRHLKIAYSTGGRNSDLILTRLGT